MHVHEKRKHSTQILADAVKNDQITEVKVEDYHLLDNEKPAQEVPIEHLKNVDNKYSKFIKCTPKLYTTINLKRKEKRKIIMKYCRRIIKVIKELEEIEQPRSLKTDWLSD